jgi:hypothetical protein
MKGWKFKEPEWMDRIHAPAWVVLIIAITFILRIPSFFEPYYYGDEMIYLNLGEAIKRGMVLYRDIHDNKPPLLYLLAAVAGNVFWFRAILAGWMAVTTVLFWRLSTALFPKNQLTVKVAVSVFALLTTIPLLEGQIANAEIFMIGPTIAAFYILLTKKLTPVTLLSAGVLFSISTLFKVPSFFDMGAIVFVWIFALKFKKKDIFSTSKNVFLLSVGFLAPIVATFIWYYARGAGHEYLVAAFLQNVGYLSSFRPDDVVDPFLVRNAPLLTRGAVLLISLSVMYIFRKKLSKQFLFATAWILFGLFAATLSERPYPHYMIQLVPAASLLIGMLAAVQSLEQSLAIIPLFLVLLAVVRFQFWYYPSLPYYQRFVEFISGQTTKEAYFNKFDPNTSRNYDIAEYLSTSSKRDDKVFVWGDSPGIYALAKRLPPIKYVATYHIIDFSSQKDVVFGLSQQKPEFVVVLPNSPEFPLLYTYLKDGYFQIEKIEGAKIWKHMTFSTDDLQN